MMMLDAKQISNVLRCNNQDNNKYKCHSKELGMQKTKHLQAFLHASSFSLQVVHVAPPISNMSQIWDIYANLDVSCVKIFNKVFDDQLVKEYTPPPTPQNNFCSFLCFFFIVTIMCLFCIFMPLMYKCWIWTIMTMII